MRLSTEAQRGAVGRGFRLGRLELRPGWVTSGRPSFGVLWIPDARQPSTGAAGKVLELRIWRLLLAAIWRAKP